MRSAVAVALFPRPWAHGARRTRRSLAFAATVASVGALGGSARAADSESAPSLADATAEARQQYQAGMDAYQAKRFVEAALHFEAAVAQRPHAVAIYTAALAWEQANRPDRAADDFVRALDVPGLSAAQTQNARDRVASLEKTMGTLDVHAPEGWRVQIDANTEVFVPAHLHAMPGVHSLAVEAPTRPIQHRDVTLDLGKTTRIDLAPVPVAPPSGPPVGTSPERAVGASEGSMVSSTGADPTAVRRDVGFAIAGAGVASLAAGAVLGVSALSARDTYNDAPTQVAFDHAASLQTWTNVAFVAGGVLVAGGVALALWPSPKNAPHGEPASRLSLSLVPSLGGAILRGVF